MQFSIFTTKTESFYTACAPELELVSYGQCSDEALNNLQDVIRMRDQGAEAGSHAQ